MTKENIIACEESLLNAIKTNDVEELDRLLHEDLLFVVPGGNTGTKAADLKNYGSGNINIETIRAEDRMISMIGDTAVVSVQIELKGNYLGQMLDGKFRYLRVWKKIGDQIKIIGGSCNLLDLQAD